MNTEKIYKSDQIAQRLATEDGSRERLVALCHQLEEIGVTTVTLTYDGCGDEGFIDGIYYEPKDARIEPTFTEQLEQTVDDLLPEGWEINDGAFGTVQIDVEQKKIEHEHSERYTACDTSEEVVLLTEVKS
jgi:hypothetical protein